MPLQWTARELQRAANELTNILAAAHQRLNQHGYPQATTHLNHQLWITQTFPSDNRCPDLAVLNPPTRGTT